jgi:hypothetical protein
LRREQRREKEYEDDGFQMRGIHEAYLNVGEGVRGGNGL